MIDYYCAVLSKYIQDITGKDYIKAGCSGQCRACRYSVHKSTLKENEEE